MLKQIQMVWGKSLSSSGNKYLAQRSPTGDGRGPSSSGRDLLSIFGPPVEHFWAEIINTLIDEKEEDHFFIGPESDHWQCLSVTHSLTNWLPFSKLDWCDPGVWRCQHKTCWVCYCRWCWWWESCWQQFVADLEAEVIHAKNVWCCGDGYFGQKKLRKKCVNRDKM